MSGSTMQIDGTAHPGSTLIVDAGDSIRIMNGKGKCSRLRIVRKFSVGPGIVFDALTSPRVGG